jgi:hypothetical protein
MLSLSWRGRSRGGCRRISGQRHRARRGAEVAKRTRGDFAGGDGAFAAVSEETFTPRRSRAPDNAGTLAALNDR